MNERHHHHPSDLRQIVDTIPGFVFTCTPVGELEFVNGQALEYFDRTLEHALVENQCDVVHPDDRERVKIEWQRDIAAGKAHCSEQRLLRSDGVFRWFQLRASPLRDANGRLLRWFGILTDIEDSKLARDSEESQRSLQARLARAAHRATVSELAAAIAHEVNQPIASVIANAEACQGWLSASVPDIERALRCVEKAIRDGYAAGDVVSRIRSLFKQAPPVLLPLDLNEVVAEVQDLMADDLRDKGVVVKTELLADLPLVAADRVQMQQVLVNLIRNAVESMEEVAPGARQLSIRSWALDDEVTVEVMDTGRGIDDFESLFEPFYTTKASGMGMGLPICKSILEGHGGRLWATSYPSLGATFGAVLRALR